jgi:hypothetical protein
LRLDTGISNGHGSDCMRFLFYKVRLYLIMNFSKLEFNDSRLFPPINGKNKIPGRVSDWNHLSVDQIVINRLNLNYSIVMEKLKTRYKLDLRCPTVVS